MAAYDNSYSRFVAWTKILLPLAGLALLSTLFLFSRGGDPTANLPFSQADVTEIAREQRLSSPKFAGVTEDGSSIEVSAAVARPDLDQPQRMTGDDLRATVTLPGGATVVVTAPKGEVDASASTVTLNGGVHIVTSNGYQMTSDDLLASIAATSLTTSGAVDADGPLGTLNAGRMDLSLQNNSYLLVFKDRVKLIYDPTKGERP